MSLEFDINELRNSEGYAKMSEKDQYKVHVETVIKNLEQNPKYQEADFNTKKEAVAKLSQKTFTPTFENPEMGQATQQLMEAYKVGDQAARQSMINYTKTSYFNEKASMTYRLLNSLGNPYEANKAAGLMNSYAQNALAVNKTRGADDNKARSSFLKLFEAVGDEEALSQIDLKRMDTQALVSRIGEGLILGLVSGVGGAAIGGSFGGVAGATSTAAKVGVGAKALAASFVKKTLPIIAAEASIEGAFGLVEYMSDTMHSGNAASVKGAVKAFGIYAGLDAAANIALGTVFPIIKYTGIPYVLGKGKGKKVTLEAIEAALEKGEDLGGLIDTLRPEIKGHNAASKMYKKTLRSLNTPADLDGLTEMQKLNYDGFEMGYSISKQDGSFMVVPQDNFRSTRTFDNLYDAKDWMSSRAYNKRLKAKIEEGNFEDLTSYIERHAGAVKRQISRTNIDEAFETGSKVNKGGIPISNRQFVSPEEIDVFKNKTSEFIQIDTPVTRKLASSKKLIYKATDDLVIPKSSLSMDGNTYISTANFAGPEDWAKALEQGKDAALREGGFTAEQWAKDRLIGADFHGAIDSDGAYHVFFPDRIKISSNRVNPKTGKLGNIIERDKEKTTAKVTLKTKVTPFVESINNKTAEDMIQRLTTKNKITVWNKNSDGSFIFEGANKVIKASDAKDAVNKLSIYSMDEGILRKALVEEGYDISGSIAPRQMKSISKDGSAVISGRASLQELVIDSDIKLSTLPDSLAPSFTLTSKIAGEPLEVSNTFVMGSQPRVNNFMSSFTDYHKKAMSNAIYNNPATGDGILKIGKTTYEVEIPEIGLKKQFKSAAEARQFVSKGWKKYSALQDAALDKGFRLYMEDGQYALRASNKKFTASTTAELYEQLAKVKNVTYKDSIIPAEVSNALDDLGFELELPPGFDKITQDAVDDIPTVKNDPTKAKRILGDLRDYLLPKRASIQRNLKALGDTALTKNFNDLENHVQIAYNAHQRYVREGFDLLGGLSETKRKGITYWIEEDNLLTRNVIATEFGLDNEALAAASKLEDMYKELANDLGIDFLTRLKNYQPRIRKFAHAYNAGLVEEGLTTDLYESTIGKEYFNTPEMRQFFARFERTQDLVNFARDEDALSIFLTYSKKGHNELYLKDIWNDMDSLLKRHTKDINAESLRDLFEGYREAITHSTSTLDRRVINQSAAKVMKRLGVGSDSAKRYLDLLVNGSYMVNMSWRPWQPFRNLWQVFNVLPSKTGGVGYSVRAIKKFVADPDRLVGEMVGRGVFPDNASFADQLRELYSSDFPKGIDWVLNFGQKGLNWFKSSDQATRVVAALSADELMEKAYKRGFSATGVLNEGKFLRDSRLEVFPESVRLNVMEQVKLGNKQAAMDIYAREMVNATMFDYTAFNRPLAAKSSIGSLYYQYMTYPLNLANSLAQTMSNGSVGGRVKSALALGVGAGAIAMGMKELGIDNSQFMTWNQISLGGGPLWSDMYLLTQLFVTEPRTAMQHEARRRYLAKIGVRKEDGELALMYPQMLPGRIQVKYFAKAVEAAEKGDYWKAFLYLTTTPIDKSYNAATGLGGQ